MSETRRTHPPAGGDGGAGEPGGAVVILRHAARGDLGDVVHGEAVVDVAAHGELCSLVCGVQVDQARDHVRREGHDERLAKTGGDIERSHRRCLLVSRFMDIRGTKRLTFSPTRLIANTTHV